MTHFEYKSTEIDLESICGSYYYILHSPTCFASSYPSSWKSKYKRKHPWKR